MRAVLYQAGELALLFPHSCGVIPDRSTDFISNRVLREALGRGGGSDL